METNRLYFLIVNYHSTDLIKRLLDSLKNNSPGEYQVVIINNSVDDQAIAQLETESIKIIEAGDNLGFGRACNLGLNWIYRQNSRGVVWLINPDAYFGKALLDRQNSETSQIEKAIAFFAQHPQISILGTVVYDATGKITTAGGTFTPGTAALTVLDSLPEDLRGDYFPVDWVSGCSLLLNLANFAQCPSFDPHYFLYYEDLDFCLRYGQQGYQIAVTYRLEVFHDTSTISDRHLLTKYQHITKSYLIHLEKHGNLATFVLTNLRMFLNTIRLLIFKPEQGLGKLIGLYNYWQARLRRRFSSLD
jgi:N-acetylglucosaminyl-diphospho-decaprenol L-rhamnosyltransferase